MAWNGASTHGASGKPGAVHIAVRVARRASGELRATGLFAIGNQVAGSAFTPLVVGYELIAGGGILDRYRLYDRAYELAASGQHIDCITIVATLTSDGFMEAADALANEELRSELRKICQQHWRHDRSNQATGPSAPTYPVRE